MPRRTKSTRAARVGRALEGAATIPKRIDERVRPFATWLGWLGTAALAGCGVLAAMPDAEWPDGLIRARLPVYVTISLVAASLLGWAYMQQGQSRIERRVGRRAAFWLFVALPIAAAVLGIVEDKAPLGPGARASWSTLFSIARWYSPAAIVASVAAFMSAKARRSTSHGIAYTLLFAPYAVLLAALVFGFHFPWIDEPLHDTLGALGGGAVALQLALAWFVGGSW